MRRFVARMSAEAVGLFAELRHVFCMHGLLSALRAESPGRAYASGRMRQGGPFPVDLQPTTFPRQTVANIYLLINRSLSNAWLAATMRANQRLLAEHNIDLAPFDHPNEDFIPYNTSFWYASASAPLPPALAEKLTVVRTSLEAGRHVLFLGQSADLDVEKTFFAFLRKYLPTETHRVTPLLLMGKLGLNMEIWWQETPQGVNEALAAQYLDNSCNGVQFVRQAQEAWGQENVTLIPILYDTISADKVAETARRVFAALGLDAVPQPAAPLPFSFFVNTITAQRLLVARQVRHNDWPPLDNAAYVTALQQAERGWEPEPASALAYRQLLLEKGRDDQADLENLLGLPAHALDVPAWYGVLPAADVSAPLRPERLQAFAAALPPSAREALLRRFANDRDLLTEDQQALAEALAAAEGAAFARLEEVGPQPTLTVLTMAHNHEKYIGQCIESVLAQQTDFPVRHLILDHYSQDGTPQIISNYARDYPSIRPVLLHNFRIAYRNVHSLFVRCKSEYAALCDGDDYFLDPHKLQKQVNFLQQHPRCALCFHPVAVVFEDGRQPGVFPAREMLPRGIREEYYLADLLKGNMIQTNSVVYKWRFRDGIPDWFREDLCPGDWYWHLLHAEMGKIGFLPGIMSAYRRHSASLYKYSFIDRLRHRRKFGMQELETYHVVNEHFQNRYFLPLASLANGVLCDFMEIYLEEDDKRLLDLAFETYPKFKEYFLSQLTLTKQHPLAQKGQDNAAQ